MGAGGGDCAAVRAELLRPGLSGGGGLRVDIGGGAGAGRSTTVATTGATTTGADGDFFAASFGATFAGFAGAAAGNLATVVLPTGLTSDFTAAFNGEPGEDFLTDLPGDKGVPGEDTTTATFFAAFRAVANGAAAGWADEDATAFFAAPLRAGSTTAGNFLSWDFTMVFL